MWSLGLDVLYVKFWIRVSRSQYASSTRDYRDIGQFKIKKFTRFYSPSTVSTLSF